MCDYLISGDSAKAMKKKSYKKLLNLLKIWQSTEEQKYKQYEHFTCTSDQKHRLLGKNSWFWQNFHFHLQITVFIVESLNAQVMQYFQPNAYFTSLNSDMNSVFVLLMTFTHSFIFLTLLTELPIYLITHWYNW